MGKYSHFYFLRLYITITTRHYYLSIFYIYTAKWTIYITKCVINSIDTKYIYRHAFRRIYFNHTLILIQTVMFVYKPPECITQKHTLGLRGVCQLGTYLLVPAKQFFFSYLWLLDASQMDIIMPIINAAEQYSANIFNVYWRKNCIHNSNCKTTFSIQQRRWYVSPRNHTQLMLPHRHTTASYLVHCLIIKAIVCRDGMVAGCAIMMFLQICWRP